MASPYEVAIHLTVTGNAQAGLAGLSTQMNKLNEGAEKLHKAFALIFVGGEMKRWGEETIGFVNKLLDAAGNFQHVQSQMSAMGMTQKEIADSVGTSWKNATANIHVGVQEMAEMNRHAIEIFGGAEAAAEHMGLMSKLADLQARWGAGKTGLKQVDVPMAIRDLMKTDEGAAMLQKDPKLFDTFAEKLMRAMFASGGNVSFTQYLQAQRLARGAQFGWTDEYRFGVFPALVQEYGHAAGVSGYQAFKRLGAGVGWDKTGIVQGIEMGLIDPNKVEYDKVGRPMRLMAGALRHTKEFGEDPLKYTEKYITPWLDRNVGPDPAARTGALVRLLGRSTAITDIQALDMQPYKLRKDIGQYKRARLEIPDDYAQAMLAFEEKWKDFMVAVGTPSLKLATEALGNVTKAIMALTGAALAHPDATRNLVAIAAGFGVVMTALGALAIGAGIVGLLGGGVIIVGLTALTGALAGLAAANWPTIKSYFQEFLDSLTKTNWNKEITDSLARVIPAMKDWLWNFGQSIIDAFKGMWENFKGEIRKLISYEGADVGGGGIIRTSYGGAAAGGLGRHFGGGGGGTSRGAGGISGLSGAIVNYPTGTNPILAAIDAATPGDPRTRQILRNIYGSESGHGSHWDSNTRGEDSWSPYQLNRHGGLGALFERETRLSVRDEKNLQAITNWTADYVRRHRGPLSQWRGLQHPERFGHLYGGYSHGGHAHMPPPSKPKETIINNHIHMDGKIIARSTSKHLANHAQYATSVGRQDGRGTFMGPGAEVFA